MEKMRYSIQSEKILSLAKQNFKKDDVFQTMIMYIDFRNFQILKGYKFNLMFIRARIGYSIDVTSGA